MASSLDKLATYLNDDNKKIIQTHFPDPKKFKLICRKGVFPYEYVDKWEECEGRQLPLKEDFFSKLTDRHISDHDYEHATVVWEEFDIQTPGKYSDLYLKTDVLLLADIFENFRKNCYDTYELDPLHYFTAPGLAFDAMLKSTAVNLELLTDPEMVLFIKKGIRGGVAQFSNRYAHANNPFMRELYNPLLENSYSMYFDINNLYGAAMSTHLPYDSFKWEEEIEVDIMQIPDDAPIGCILGVDLEYPRELHDLHKGFPLCPQHFTPPGSKYMKFATTLLPKVKYVVHYRNLKQCLG
uniref:DNA-directed DNA polymerase n=1 Tax=Bracon brevicornis TaxID=1563983 RepID=A0A6V7JVZ3_9HYME